MNSSEEIAQKLGGNSVPIPELRVQLDYKPGTVMEILSYVR